jgi:hypothetical protein
MEAAGSITRLDLTAAQLKSPLTISEMRKAIQVTRCPSVNVRKRVQSNCATESRVTKSSLILQIRETMFTFS